MSTPQGVGADARVTLFVASSENARVAACRTAPIRVVGSYDTIRAWCAKFGQAYANQLHRRRARPGDKWHLNEVFVEINGTIHYPWRAVDQHGNLLDVLMQPRRNALTPSGWSADCSRACNRCRR